MKALGWSTLPNTQNRVSIILLGLLASYIMLAIYPARKVWPEGASPRDLLVEGIATINGRAHRCVRGKGVGGVGRGGRGGPAFTRFKLFLS